MNVEDWLGVARLLAVRPGFMGTTDIWLQMRAHDLARNLAAGKSFDEYERLFRMDVEALSAYTNFTYAAYFAIPLVPMGAILEFSLNEDQTYWFFWACALAGVIGNYGLAQRRKANRLMGEVIESGYHHGR
jgi:hypothetical protein